MEAKPEPQHAWLKRWVGEWSFESECAGEPGAEPVRSGGREVVRAIGDLWIVGEASGDAPDGTPYTAVLTVGFDPKRGRIVGSWVGSMMTHLWVYDGWLNADELTLEAEGDSFAEPGTVTKHRDITELVSDDERRFRSEMLDPKGQWQQIMSAVYRRSG